MVLCYLLGENEQADLFKVPKMHQCLKDISVLLEKKSMLPNYR